MAIIQQAVDRKDPLKSVSGYDPDKIEVDPAQDTVQGQIQSIIAKNSPLQRQAETRARQEANRRGLLSSTMAVEAGQEAVLSSALPIAQQDAGTFYDARRTNVGASNVALGETAAAANQAGIIERTGQQSLEQIQAGGVAERGIIEAQGEQARQNIAATGEQARETVTATGEQTRETVVASGIQDRMNIAARGGVDLTNIYAQGSVASGLQGELFDLKEQFLTADTNEQIRIMNRQEEIDRSLTELETIEAIKQIQARGGVDRLSIAEQYKYNDMLQESQGDINEQLIGAEGQLKQDLESAMARNREALQGIIGDQKLEQMDRKLESDTALLKEQSQIDKDLVTARGDEAVRLENRRGEIETKLNKNQFVFDSSLQAQRITKEADADLARITAEYGGKAILQQLTDSNRAMIENNKSGAIMYAGLSKNISDLATNPDLDADVRDELIAEQIGLMEAGFSFITSTDKSAVIDSLFAAIEEPDVAAATGSIIANQVESGTTATERRGAIR